MTFLLHNLSVVAPLQERYTPPMVEPRGLYHFPFGRCPPTMRVSFVKALVASHLLLALVVRPHSYTNLQEVQSGFELLWKSP